MTALQIGGVAPTLSLQPNIGRQQPARITVEIPPDLTPPPVQGEAAHRRWSARG